MPGRSLGIIILWFCLVSGFFASPISVIQPLPFNTSLSHYELEARESTWHPDYTLHITAEDITLSCRKQYSILVNGQHPGPLLRFTEGETKWVRVYNHLGPKNKIHMTEIAMHWHGLDVDNSEDGTPESQKLIASGRFRDYEITPVAGSAGSYLYHDHAMSFGASTATGPLIVDPADPSQDPYHKYDERIIFLSDVFSKSDIDIENGLTKGSFAFSGEARSILVNGKGYGNFDVEQYLGGWRDFDSSLINPTPHKDTCEIEVIRVTAGKNYRLRFISGTTMSFNTFAMLYDKEKMDSRPMVVIEADGEYTQALKTQRLSIASGQRYSVLLTADVIESYRPCESDGQSYNFWLEGREVNREDPSIYRQPILINIQVDPPQDSNAPQLIPLNGVKRHFSGNKEPLDLRAPPQGWDNVSPHGFGAAYKSFTGMQFKLRIEADLPLKPYAPYTDFPEDNEVTALIDLRGVDQEERDSKKTKVTWSFNQNPYFGPPNGMPRLLGIRDKKIQYSTKDKNHYDERQKFYAFGKNDVVDIVFSNVVPQHALTARLALDDHPMHIHGAHYFDLGAGGGEFSQEALKKVMEKGNILKRDTSMLYSKGRNAKWPHATGWRVVRIKVERLGVWLVHCHMLQHMMMGMSVPLVFGSADEIGAIKSPELDGWDSMEPRNVFHKKAHADPFARVKDGIPFREILKEIDTTRESLGEAFGIRPVD